MAAKRRPRPILATVRRELTGYFVTPVAYVFIVIFLMAAASLTLFIGGLFPRGQADLVPFFTFLPWLFLVLVPAISMRLWAEERRAGTLELLFTLPITVGQAVLAKFLAAWLFLALALILTVPLWITVAWLGEPDHGVILASYVGAFLMGGAYLAIGSAVSAITGNQVIAFVLAVAVGFVLTAMGSPVAAALVGDAAPPALVSAVAAFSLLDRFAAIQRGVIDLSDLLYYLSTIALFLYVTTGILEARKA